MLGLFAIPPFPGAAASPLGSHSGMAAPSSMGVLHSPPKTRAQRASDSEVVLSSDGHVQRYEAVSVYLSDGASWVIVSI